MSHGIKNISGFRCKIGEFCHLSISVADGPAQGGLIDIIEMRTEGPVGLR